MKYSPLLILQSAMKENLVYTAINHVDFAFTKDNGIALMVLVWTDVIVVIKSVIVNKVIVLRKCKLHFFTKIMSQKPYQGIIEKKTGVFSNYYIMKMFNNPWQYISELFIYIFEKLISQIKQVIFP